MSPFLTVGVTHHDAGLPQLEQAAVSTVQRERLQEAALAAGCAEILVLSTYSRIEVHAVLDPPADATGPTGDWCIADRLAELLLRPHRPNRAAHPTVATGEDAVRRLFRVAAGLDSRIMGETEVQAPYRVRLRRSG